MIPGELKRARVSFGGQKEKKNENLYKITQMIFLGVAPVPRVPAAPRRPPRSTRKKCNIAYCVSSDYLQEKRLCKQRCKDLRLSRDSWCSRQPPHEDDWTGIQTENADKRRRTRAAHLVLTRRCKWKQHYKKYNGERRRRRRVILDMKGCGSGLEAQINALSFPLLPAEVTVRWNHSE